MVKGDLIVENPNVGRKLDLFLDGGGVWAVFDEPVRRADVGWNLGFYLIDRGPQGQRLDFEVMDSFGSHGHYPQDRALNELAPAFGREHKEFMKKWNYFGRLEGGVRRQSVVRGQMDSSGREIIKRDHPAIVKRTQEGRELMRDILLKMGAKRVSDISKLEMGEGGAHSVVSCRAGSDRSNSVVNSDFECHDVENLFLCDASVVPSIPSAHNGGTGTAFMACHAWRRIVAKHFSR